MFGQRNEVYRDTGGWIVVAGNLEQLIASQCEADTLAHWQTRRTDDIGTAIAYCDPARPLHIVPAHLSRAEWEAAKFN